MANDPFNQPVGQALVQAAQLINQVAGQRQQLELQRSKFEEQKKQNDILMEQREKTFALKEQEFELNQQQEKRLQAEQVLRQKTAAGTTPLGELNFELKNLEIKKRRKELEESDPTAAAQLKAFDAQLERQLRAVGGPFSEFSIEDLQEQNLRQDRIIAAIRADPFKSEGDLSEAENTRVEINNALKEKTSLAVETINKQPEEFQALIKGHTALPVEKAASITLKPQSLAPTSEILGAEQILAEAVQIDRPRLETDAAFRSQEAKRLAQQVFEFSRSNRNRDVRRQLFSELASKLGVDFVNDMTQEIIKLSR